jgi:hypothetical protein
MVLSRLVDESDVVLMDVRGFSSQNAGCIFEINELIDMMPLDQVVFIIDQTSDEAFLRQTIQHLWEQMKSTSPNRVLTSGLLHVFRFSSLHNRDLHQILHVLSIAAITKLKTRTST